MKRFKAKLNLRESWRGFKKRSIEYKLACFYFCLALIFFLFTIWTAYQLTQAYDPDVEIDPEKIPVILKALSFLTMLTILAGLPAFVCQICLIAGLVFLLSDHHRRLKKLEKEEAEKNV